MLPLFKLTKCRVLYIHRILSLVQEEVKAFAVTDQLCSPNKENRKMKSTILLALLVFHGLLQSISAQSGSKKEARDTDLGESYYKCPTGLFIAPHETHCELYYICSAGDVPTHLFQCSGDLLFDLKYNGCNYKEFVDCGDRLPRFTCPSPNGNFPVQEGACDSRYYICGNGVAKLQNCPPESIFDASTSSCAPPGTIICPTLNAAEPRTTPGPFECPEPNGLFSSPYSCSHFYLCQNEIPYLYECPSGLY